MRRWIGSEPKSGGLGSWLVVIVVALALAYLLGQEARSAVRPLPRNDAKVQLELDR